MKQRIWEYIQRRFDAMGDTYSDLAEWHNELRHVPADPTNRWYYEQERKEFEQLCRTFNRREKLYRVLARLFRV